MYGILTGTLTISFVSLIIYLVVGAIIKLSTNKVARHYSPLDVISLFIFAGLTETAIVEISGKVEPLSYIFGACFIILFHQGVSRTELYKKLFPLSRHVVIKNGRLIRGKLHDIGVDEDHLWVELRKNDIINMVQVKEASFEANGDFSILRSIISDTDPITGLEFSWSSAEDWLNKLMASGSHNVTCVVLDFINTSEKNKEFGEDAINRGLREVADLCSTILRYDDRLFRFEQDRFLFVLNVGHKYRGKVLQSISDKLLHIQEISDWGHCSHVITLDKGADFSEAIDSLRLSVSQNKGGSTRDVALN